MCTIILKISALSHLFIMDTACNKRIRAMFDCPACCALILIPATAPLLCNDWQWALEMNKPLSETDPDLFDIMEHEKVCALSSGENVEYLLLMTLNSEQMTYYTVKVLCWRI